MKLSTYLDESKITKAVFAASIEVSVQALHRYIDGKRIPRPEVMARISAATSGRVQPNDFFDITLTPCEAA